MTERVSRFRMLHGIVKGAIRNIIDLAHSRIPKEDLITDGKNRPNQPELRNIAITFDNAMKKFQENNQADYFETHAYKVLTKGKEIALSTAASDSAYYLMMEYALKEYIHLKMDKAFGYDAVEKAWFDQWKDTRQELLKEVKQ